MPPLPNANDAPDSLFWSTTSERPFSRDRVTGNARLPARSAVESAASAPVSVGASSRSTSRHSPTDHEPLPYRGRRSPSPLSSVDSVYGVQDIILASFAPRVSVLASADTDDIAKEKGFAGGFYSLLRPFGEDVPGKVVVRDSIGASKAWDNFSIRLIQYGEDPQTTALLSERLQPDQQIGDCAGQGPSLHSSLSSTVYEQHDASDALLEHFLLSAEARVRDGLDDSDSRDTRHQGLGKPSSTYTLYLRKLMSGTLQVPYETFTHQVACIIAVSSRCQGPLEKIRQLYSASGRSNTKIPPWVGVDYLRYYVLVHDEDRDDIARSTALFDLMKRHFGLHCYLLRLRSMRCANTDDDSVQMSRCMWLSIDEELAAIRESDHDDGFAPKECVFESDAAALKSFIRELVTQSIIPFMESRVVTWNDQVASKRRGIGGKLMSLSKRWTVFGSSKGSNSTTAGGTSSPNSNFDSARGFYPPESPEAIMRQLADYAFMLRDFKLAFSTYDTLRTDFSNDKAWLYHASASELTCVSYLLIPQTLSNRSRSEMVDHKLDAALYSYLGRSSMPTGAVRAIIMTAELLIGRGPAAAEDAAKWAIRSLDLSILSPLPQALLTERIADFYGLQVGSGRLGLGSRRRQTVLWNTLASAVWVKLDQPAQARRRLRQARTGMSEISDGVVGVPFPAMHPLDADIEQGAAGRKDEDLIELDPAVMGNHDNGDIYQMDKRLGKQATLGEPQTADTSGFFTIEANHPGFETAS